MAAKYLFDPLQFEEFGFLFYQGEGFSVKYQLSRVRLVFQYLYIPFGPIAENEQGWVNFMTWLKSFKMTKIKLDLPLILAPSIKNEVQQSLLGVGFRPSNYFLDEETVLVTPESYKLSSNGRRYVRKTEGKYDLELYDSPLNPDLLAEIYEIYKNNAQDKGFPAEKFATFSRINTQGNTIIGRNSETQTIDGFILGYQTQVNAKQGVVAYNYIVFSAFNKTGRDNNLGYLLRDAYIKNRFAKGDEIIDFHGASRSKKRSYSAFKAEFGGEFVTLAGSFTKLNLL